MGNDSQAYTYSGGPCRSLPYRIKWTLSIQFLRMQGNTTNCYCGLRLEFICFLNIFTLPSPARHREIQISTFKGCLWINRAGKIRSRLSYVVVPLTIFNQDSDYSAIIPPGSFKSIAHLDLCNLNATLTQAGYTRLVGKGSALQWHRSL